MVQLNILYKTIVLLKADQDTERLSLSFRFVLLAEAKLYYHFILKK